MEEYSHDTSMDKRRERADVRWLQAWREVRSQEAVEVDGDSSLSCVVYLDPFAVAFFFGMIQR